MKDVHRPGRPKNPKLILLESVKSSDTQDFTLGVLEVPDITQKDVADYLIKWDGDYNALSFIAMRRIKKDAIPKCAAENKVEMVVDQP